jgi:hypothetical protein
MSVYNSTSPNAYDKGLVPTEVRNQYFEELLLASPLSSFMGETSSAMIQVVHKKKGTGLTTTFQLLRELEYKTSVTGYDQYSGKGHQIKFYSDTLKLDQDFIGAKLEGLSLTELTTPIDVFNAIRPEVLKAHKQKVTFKILESATFKNYDNIATQGPSNNRVIYSGTVRHNDGTILSSIDNMGAATPDESGAKVADFLALREIAINGGKDKYREEKRISPYQIENTRQWISPFFCLFIDTKTMNSLRLDPNWTAQERRGVIESPYQPSIIKGGMLRGMIENIYVYEVPELGDFRIANGDGSKKVAWNLFCGAQAFGLAWSGTPWLDPEYSNHREDYELGLFDLRGQKVLKFPSYQDETKEIENGLIHYFTRYA